MYQDQEITGTYTAQCLYMHAYDLLVLINVLTVNRAVIKDFKVLGVCIL